MKQTHLALIGVLLAASVASAQQRPRVDIQVQGLFGDDLVGPTQHASILVTLSNRTRTDFQGELEVAVTDWRNSPEKHIIPVDLPAQATRRAQLVVYVRDSGAQVRAKYSDGTELGSGSMGVGYNAAAEGIVVLSDPPRLRSALLDIETEQADQYGSNRVVNLPVGTISLDPDTGDPIAPLSPAGWGGITLVAAAAPMLERLNARQQQALNDWLRTGGEMVIFPRTPEDVRGPYVRNLVGPVEWVEEYAATGHDSTVPPQHRGRGFSFPPGARARPEAFGMSVSVGFGRVFLATYDGTSPPHVDARETHTLIDSLVQRYRTPGIERPLFPFGGRDMSAEEVGGWEFRSLRTVLDPNESFRPALGLVAVVLLLYVFVVGPINFSWVGKRNKPTLALVTTPVAAAGCLLILLTVGYVGKGTTMRFRSVSLLELQDGDPEGPQRRYMGLFLTRPASFDMPSAQRGVTRLMFEGGVRRPTHAHEGGDVMLEGLQGGLWETLFVREESIVNMGAGGIVLESQDNYITSVHNRSETGLRGAFILDASGGVYPIGDIPPGARAQVAGAATLNIGVENPAFWGESDPEIRSLGSTLGLDREDSKAIYGLSQTLGGTLVNGMPTLWALVDDEPNIEAELFVEEMDIRFVRVVASGGATPVPIRYTRQEEQQVPNQFDDVNLEDMLGGAEELQEALQQAGTGVGQ